MRLKSTIKAARRSFQGSQEQMTEWRNWGKEHIIVAFP